MASFQKRYDFWQIIGLKQEDLLTEFFPNPVGIFPLFIIKEHECPGIGQCNDQLSEVLYLLKTGSMSCTANIKSNKLLIR